MLCALVLLIVTASSLIWIDHNPGAIDWDNAEYINMAMLDHHAYQREGLRGLLSSLLTVDPARPPGYRIVVLPMTLAGGVSVLILRLTSLLLMGVMAVMIYLAVSPPGGQLAGILAAALASSLVVVQQSMRIYRTETSLYPCVVGVLLFLIIGLYRARIPALLWMGLGLSLGLGALSKITFVSVGGPAMVAAAVLAWHGALGRWRIWQLAAAGAVACVVAGPLYARNFRGILASAREAASFVRHGYDAWSWAHIREWLSMVAAWGFGWGAVMLLIALTIASAVLGGRRLLRGRPPQRRSATAVSIYLCVAAGVPIIASQLLLTTTWTTRHVSPGYLALTMAVCIVAGATGALRSRLVWLAAAVLFYVQLAAWTPDAINSRRDPWNWEQLYDAVHDRADPIYIVHLGNGTSFNPPFIQAPWVQRGKVAWERWLWRYEDGPVDWSKIDKELARANVVLTAPGYVGDVGDKQDRDNAYNDEFARRLRADSRFAELAAFQMGGPQDHGTVVVFSRRSASPPAR